MSLRSPYRVLDDIAREYGAKDIDLLPEVMAGLNAKKRTTMKFTPRRAAVVVLIVLMVLIIVISAPAAVTAMKRLLGFIPDVGVVEESTPLRKLAEPAILTRDEITVMVEQAVADSEHTLVNYKVESLSVTAYSDDKKHDPHCVTMPRLRLPDGKELEGSGIQDDSWATGYQQQISYPALPADVQEAVLYLPCLLQTRCGSTPEDWEIPLKFVTAQPGVDLTVYPVIDVATPTYQPLSTEDASYSETGSFKQPAGISLHLDQYVQVEDGFILYGRLQWDDADISIDLVDSTAVHLWDSSGKEIALQEDYTAGDGSHTVDGEYSLVYKTAGIYAAGEAVFQIDSAMISKDVHNSFIFDPGAQPQPGQTWRLDRVLDIDGQTLRIESVSLNETADSLTFMMDSESGISGAVLGDYEHPMLGGGGGPGCAGFTYDGGLPQGAITVTVSNVSLELAGPWSVAVDLPPTSLDFTATPPPHVCITEETWRNALDQAKPGIPDNLTGIISISSLSAPDYIYKVMVADLSGSSRTMAEGDSPSLSPDGLSLVYDAADGLVVMDVASGTASTLPGTSKRDLNPLWSPDGRYIAFNRGPASGLIGAPGAYDIMVMNVDGSGMSQLTSGDDANYVQEWMPDGKHILYTVAGENGAEIKMIDVTSGEISSLFEVNYRNTGIAVSPDGKSIAYEEMLPGEHYAISLAHLDGSNRRLLADGYPLVITNMAWSPDGQWLAVTVQDTAETDYKLSLALLQIDTCQLIPLPDIEGYPSSWVR